MTKGRLSAVWFGGVLAACGGGESGQRAPEANVPDVAPPADMEPAPAPLDMGPAPSPLDMGAGPPICPDERCPAVDLRDRACQEATTCPATEGCSAAGECGVCAQDAECRAGERCAAGACLPDALPEWSLDVAPLDLQRIINFPEEDIFVPCALAVEGVRYDQGCRVRLRGGTSRGFPKKSFRITFDPGAPHPGINRKINLRAEYNDRTFMRNFLAVQTLRRLTVVPAPSARFVRLTLNGAFYGLMTEVDTVDDDFFEAQGLSPDAPTYEADPPFELSPLGAGALMPLPDPALYPRIYDKKIGDPDDYSDLVDLIEGVIWPDYLSSRAGGPTAERLSQVVDVAEYLDYLAVMGLLQEQDHIRKNYYLTLQPRPAGPPRWLAVAWDMDLSFGCLWDEMNLNTLCDSHIVDEDPTRGRLPDGIDGGYPAQYFYNQLAHQVLADPVLRGAFDARLCGYISGAYWTSTLPALIDATAAHIRESVEQDANDLNADLSAFDAEVALIHDFVMQRAAFVSSFLGCPN